MGLRLLFVPNLFQLWDLLVLWRHLEIFNLTMEERRGKIIQRLLLPMLLLRMLFVPKLELLHWLLLPMLLLRLLFVPNKPRDLELLDLLVTLELLVLWGHLEILDLLACV